MQYGIGWCFNITDIDCECYVISISNYFADPVIEFLHTGVTYQRWNIWITNCLRRDAFCFYFANLPRELHLQISHLNVIHKESCRIELLSDDRKIGRASCRERVCQYV